MNKAHKEDGIFDTSTSKKTSKQDIEKTKIEYQDKLTKYLLDNNIITKEQLRTVIRFYKKSSNKKMIYDILIDLSIISEEQIIAILHSFKGVKSFNIKSAILDQNLVQQIPKEFAQQNYVIPISQQEDILYIGMRDTYNIEIIDTIYNFFSTIKKIIPIYVPAADLLSAIDKYYGHYGSIEQILSEMEEGADNLMEKDVETNPSNNKSIIKFMDSLLIDAVKHKASDIHFEPGLIFLRIRYRIDGSLREKHSLSVEFWPSITVRIKIMGGMNIAEKRHPQDGRISCSIMGRNIDIRVSTQPTVDGENCVMRILDSYERDLTIKSLELSEEKQSQLKKILIRPEGMIVVTGPTGSGKTTTLYSMINHINSPEINIMTMEDPVEYRLPLIRQSAVSEKLGSMNFEEGIKSLMRQDPDVIFVGEIRDKETAMLAIRASMTGHKVLTSLHSNNAIGVLPRLVNIGITSSNISYALNAIVSQRLLRKLCNACKKPRIITEKEQQLLQIQHECNVYDKIGCELCSNTGYSGRVLVCEIMQIDKETRNLIATDAGYKKIMHHLVTNQNYQPIYIDAIQKLLEGIIDIQELIARIDITDI